MDIGGNSGFLPLSYWTREQNLFIIMRDKTLAEFVRLASEILNIETS